MNYDPHVIQQILLRVQQQVRCPQCGSSISAELRSVQVMVEDVIVMHLQCESCDAHIILHASFQGVEITSVETYQNDPALNVSSTLQVSQDELKQPKNALGGFEGSFEDLFKKFSTPANPSAS